MSDYTVSRILPTDKRAVRQMDALLEKEGIERDKNLDYSIGLFDDNYDLVATGSCFANTLRCMAVSSEHQGEGLMNQIISHLIEFQYSRGNMPERFSWPSTSPIMESRQILCLPLLPSRIARASF